MKLNDAQLGKPGILFKDTKANIEALTGLAEGSTAYATDTNEFGSYSGAAWAWDIGGGGDVTGSGTIGTLAKFTAAKTIGNATNTDTQVAAAVTASHANTNDPTADEKAALVGTSGTPSTSNKYVTNADSRNSDARVPTAHTIDGASHTVAGRTAGQLLRATAATAFGWSTATYPDTAAKGGLVVATDANVIGALAVGLTTQVLVGGGAAIVPAWSTNLPTALTIGTAYIYRAGGIDVAVADGGTNLSSYAVGDLPYASATTTIAKLAVSVPAATFMNYVGLANGDTVPGYKALFDATVPTTVAESAAAAAGTATVSARRDHTHGAPATWAATAHAIDGTKHTITGAALSLVGATAPDTLGLITPSAAGGATAHILATDATGYTRIEGLAVGMPVVAGVTFDVLVGPPGGSFRRYANIPLMAFNRANGSAGSETAVASGESVGVFGGYGWDGSTYSFACAWYFTVDGAVSAGIVPGRIQARVRDSTGAVPFVMTIKSTGNVGFGTELPATQAHIVTTNATTDSVVNVFTLGKNVTGAGVGAANLGVAQIFQMESSTTVDTSAARIYAQWYVATHASRQADLVLTAYDTAEREGIRIRASGAAAMLGFYGVTPVVRPAALTTALTTITCSAPGTPDYAIADLVQNTGYGFVSADEGQSTLKVIANLQTRVGEIETKLVSLGLLT